MEKINLDQEKLRIEANAKFLSKTKAAQDIGISFFIFSRWLNGHDVGLEVLTKINKWLYENDI